MFPSLDAFNGLNIYIYISNVTGVLFGGLY